MASSSTPTVSRVLPDGTLIDLVYDADRSSTTLAVAEPGRPIALRERIDLSNGDTLIPYSATNNLLSSASILFANKIVESSNKALLIRDIKAFLHRYIDLSPVFEEIAAYYVLLSWVHDAFNEVPMLRLRGAFGSGKTRALLAIGSLCYKGFFASGASTVSPIFHILHEFGGTLVLDEADLRFSDATADLVKILNNGTTKGLPVLRTMTNRQRELNPMAFRVFGPKIIAMREHFDDQALESRFLTEEMGTRPLRADIALSTPDSLRTEAQALRNRLLGWRFAAHPEVAIHPARAIPTLSPRGNQMALPLLSLVDDPASREMICARFEQDEARAKAHRATQPHVAILGVLDRLFQANEVENLPVARIADEYNRYAQAELPIKSVGHIVRKRLGLETRKSAGVYVVPVHERAKVALLVERERPYSVEAV